jgi:hypothetical protein
MYPNAMRIAYVSEPARISVDACKMQRFAYLELFACFIEHEKKSVYFHKQTDLAAMECSKHSNRNERKLVESCSHVDYIV